MLDYQTKLVWSLEEPQAKLEPVPMAASSSPLFSFPECRFQRKTHRLSSNHWPPSPLVPPPLLLVLPPALLALPLELPLFVLSIRQFPARVYTHIHELSEQTAALWRASEVKIGRAHV